MAQHESRILDSKLSEWIGGAASYDGDDIVSQPSMRPGAIEEAGAAIARELNGPLTALLLYMGEIKRHSQLPSDAAGDADYLRSVVDNAVQQTERVCALVQRIAGVPAASAPCGKDLRDKRLARCRSGDHPAVAAFTADVRQKPLTRREREVLKLISEGYSNKQGALRMQISPRTFESHRAEAMRKLGARNTAELVRAALLHPID
jgi:DNA-binding NarL/FixJ family response regulator